MPASCASVLETSRSSRGLSETRIADSSIGFSPREVAHRSTRSPIRNGRRSFARLDLPVGSQGHDEAFVLGRASPDWRTKKGPGRMVLGEGAGSTLVGWT